MIELFVLVFGGGVLLVSAIALIYVVAFILWFVIKNLKFWYKSKKKKKCKVKE